MNCLFRFWWYSLDHRGVPGAPGRVVNLFKSDDNEEKVWGVAYEIDDEAQTMKHLDHREKGGYSQHIIQFQPAHKGDNSEEEDIIAPPQKGYSVVVYVGDESHPQYAKPSSVQEMAKTICYSQGPSGLNKDYLYNLAAALRQIHVHDDHVFELEKAVKMEDDKTS